MELHVSCTVFALLDVEIENIMTLKSRFGSTHPVDFHTDIAGWMKHCGHWSKCPAYELPITQMSGSEFHQTWMWW